MSPTVPDESAAERYTSAAEQGDPHAQNALGLAYQTGQGVDQDYVEALAWFRRAAEQGHAEAQWRLCEAYAAGRGVERNRAEAKAWWPPGCGGWPHLGPGKAWLALPLLDPAGPIRGRWNGTAWPPHQGSAVARLGMHYIYAGGRVGFVGIVVKALAYLDYAQFGRVPDGGSIVVTGVGNPADRPAGGMRAMLTRKMSKRQIAEAEQLLLQWTADEELPDEPVIEHIDSE